MSDAFIKETQRNYEDELDTAINIIFQRYDPENRDSLNTEQILKLFNDCLKYMGYQFKLEHDDVLTHLAMSGFFIGPDGAIGRKELRKLFRIMLKM